MHRQASARTPGARVRVHDGRRMVLLGIPCKTRYRRSGEARHCNVHGRPPPYGKRGYHVEVRCQYRSRYALALAVRLPHSIYSRSSGHCLRRAVAILALVSEALDTEPPRRQKVGRRRGPRLYGTSFGGFWLRTLLPRPISSVELVICSGLARTWITNGTRRIS